MDIDYSIKRKRSVMMSDKLYDDNDDNKSNETKKSKEEDTYQLGEFSSGTINVEDNHIYMYCDIKTSYIYDLNRHISSINRKYKDVQSNHRWIKMNPEAIYLHINSFGGSLYAAFTAIDIIERSEIPVHTIIEGASASAATLISIVGKKRYITPNAYMLIHQLSSWVSGKMNEISDEYVNLTKLTDKIKEIYKKYTNIPEDNLDDLLKHDLWWDSDKCKSVGLVDEIWKS